MTTGQIALKDLSDEKHHPFLASFVTDLIGKAVRRLPEDRETYAKLIEESTNGMVNGEQWADAAYKVKEVMESYNLA